MWYAVPVTYLQQPYAPSPFLHIRLIVLPRTGGVLQVTWHTCAMSQEPWLRESLSSCPCPERYFKAMLSKVNTTDGLWICCSLSMFSWDSEEQQLLLLRHVMAKTVAKRAENMKVSASLKAAIFAKPHVGVVSQHKLLIHATSNSTVFTQLSGLAKKCFE